MSLLPLPPLCKLPWGEIAFSFQNIAEIYEKETWPYIKCSSGGIAIDVGAHQGFHTIRLARDVEPNGCVLAFEPAPQNFEVLEYNVRRNGLKQIVRCYNIAVADYEGEGGLVTYRRDVGWDSGKHFLRGAITNQAYEDLLNGEVPLPQRVTKVQVTTLDSLIHLLNRLDLIKIDTEGAEPKVLKGGLKLIAKYHPRIVVEIHYNQLVELSQILKPFNYKLVYMGDLSNSTNPFVVFEVV